ncbi:armadillo-type protein [Pholiota molesta]|nr:armadillo-type protein [Pholiota molesta]
MTKIYLMNSLIEKGTNTSGRFMGLNDLMTEIRQDPNSFQGDESMENKVLGMVLSLVEDKISEVKNQAVKCLGQLIKILRQSQMELDISGLGTLLITANYASLLNLSCPRMANSASACAKLTPKLLGQIQKKRAITTLSQFIPISNPALFADLLKSDVLPNLSPSAPLEKQRTTVQLIAPVLSSVKSDDELREGSLQALEALVLRCPTEIDLYLPSIIEVGNKYIKYSDDEDTSYKIRRSATKLLSGVIGTRPDRLTRTYKDISPVLISRFNDREETVRLEVWATYGILLSQTTLYGGAPDLKEKQPMDAEDTPYTLLKAQLKSPKTSPAPFAFSFDCPSWLAVDASSLIMTTSNLSCRNLLLRPHRLCIYMLSFLALFFSTHSPNAYAASLPSLTPVLLKSLESFRVFSALLNSLKPVKTNDSCMREDCIADIWICATEVAFSKDRKEWEYICREEVSIGDDWVNGCVAWLMGLLKKSGRSGKVEVFGALDVLLKSYKSGIPPTLPSNLIPQVKTYISTTGYVSLLLELAPSITFPEVEHDLLNDIYTVTHSPLVSGVASNRDSCVPNLVISAEKAPKAETSPSNVAKCIGQIVQSQLAVAAGPLRNTLNISRALEATKAKPSLVTLSLLIVGELGRFMDIFLLVEEMRAAAAFAAGNIAIGNLQQFLPVIVKMVESDPKKRLLACMRRKRFVVTHCSHGQLESVADLLWGPLFENSQNAEESTRNVAAACLGKLATTQPSRSHQGSQPDTRATVVSAIRYTFADTSQSFDEVFSPLLVDFLSLMVDENLLFADLLIDLELGGTNEAHLVRDHLVALLPNLYKETVIDPTLIRIVQMGPWSHKVDDGLETRKTAYETMYTLLDTCLSKLNLHEFLGRVIPGLSDDSDEIKVISHMMLFRLSQVAPAAVSQRLDEATPQLEKTMKGANVTKDTVKQDLERAAELQRSALRAVAALSKISAGVSPKFDVFVDELKKNPTWSHEFRDLVGQ